MLVSFACFWYKITSKSNNRNLRREIQLSLKIQKSIISLTVKRSLQTILL